MSDVEFGHAEGALKQIADRVVQAKQELAQHSAQMEADLANMQRAWVGTGGLTFQQLKAAWVEKHRVVTGALDRFHAALTATEADNRAVDEAQGAGMNALLSRLGAQ